MSVNRSLSGLMLLILALSPALILPLGAQEVTVSGQLRPRHELRYPAAPGGKQFTSMRAHAALENDISVFIQLQDVRIWGEETNTLGDFDADHLDLHQGYVDIKRFNDSPLAARVGRQEVNLGGQRLVGAAGWTQLRRRVSSLQSVVGLVGPNGLPNDGRTSS